MDYRFLQEPNAQCVVNLQHPLVETFSKHLNTIGYRRNQKAIDEMNATPGSKIGVPTNPLKIKEAD
ncbi:MAG: hypothetical protein NTV68_08800, partial [Methanomicrobiales archaeon]|nr:hypothetical protein [Methanomicrobiales archaeon]